MHTYSILLKSYMKFLKKIEINIPCLASVTSLRHTLLDTTGGLDSQLRYWEYFSFFSNIVKTMRPALPAVRDYPTLPYH